MKEWRGRWTGASAVCLASGPSLTAEDLELVRAWRGPNRIVFVCNTTFRSALWADVLIGHDRQWWKTYWEEARRDFTGRCLSCAPVPPNWKIDRIDMQELDPTRKMNNTGVVAILLAVYAGCERVVLLGYDASAGPNGEIHHHGDHPRELTNARSMHRWPRMFRQLAERIAGKADVVNCSRRTALECFPRVELEEMLG